VELVESLEGDGLPKTFTLKSQAATELVQKTRTIICKR